MIKESVSTTSENNQNYISTDLFQEKSLLELKKMSAKQLFDLGKLRYPLYKSSHDESYSVITYQEAIKIIASRIKNLTHQRASIMRLADHPMKLLFY